MTALATTTDLAARNGPLTTDQLARADALLDDASEEIRAYTGQDISRATTTDVLTASGRLLILPQRPVVSVASVALVDGADRITLTDWAWNGRDEIDLLAATTATCPQYDSGTYEVTYTHGHDPVPTLIVGVVCAMVNRTLSAPSKVDGMVAETVGQYSYQLQQGIGSQGTAPALTSREERKLARAGYRRTTHTMTVRSR